MNENMYVIHVRVHVYRNTTRRIIRKQSYDVWIPGSRILYTVRLWLLETSLWKLSAGFRPSFLVDIGNWLAGSGSLSFQSCAPQARKILRAACGVRTEQSFLTGGNALLGCLGRMVRESREATKSKTYWRSEKIPFSVHLQFLSGYWKHASWGGSFLAHIGNWLAGSEGAVSNTQSLTVIFPESFGYDVIT